MRYRRVIITLFSLLFYSACGSKNDASPAPAPPAITILKDKAPFGIGAAVKSALLQDDAYKTTVLTYFSQITAEYEMKMQTIWSGENNYNWINADALVNFATANGLNVHGHALLWYQSFPDWFKNANYDSANFENKVKVYIDAVVSRYKGKLKSWDVANEIFNDNGTLRSVDCPVYKTFKDPIAFYGRCFQYAKNADPDAKLFYNDYSVVIAPSKRYSIKQMVSRFKKEGYPIDGLGEQFHYSINTDKTSIKSGLNDMATTGLLVHVSELDLKVNVNQSNTYVFSATDQQLQADTYQYIVETFEGLPANQKFAITTWGVSDKYTWLTASWNAKEYPLLFDLDFKKKPAYDGFLKGLK